MMKKRYIWIGAIIALFIICASFLLVSCGKSSLSAFCNMQGVKSVTFYESADKGPGVFDYQSGGRFYQVQEGALFEKYQSWFQSGSVSVKELEPSGEISTGPFSRGAIVEFTLQEQEESCPYEPVVVLQLDEQGIEPYNAMMILTYTDSESYRRFGKSNMKDYFMVRISDAEGMDTETIDRIVSEAW